MANTSSHSGMVPKKVNLPNEKRISIIEHVRSRAYELYESRRRDDGHALDDWLLAEREVAQRVAKRKRTLAIRSASNSTVFG